MLPQRTKTYVLFILSFILWVAIGFCCYFLFRSTSFSFFDYDLFIILGYFGVSGLLGLIVLQGRRYLKSDELLENSNRNHLYNLICDHPGIHFCEIKRTIPLSNGIIQHHLNVLSMAGRIKGVKIGQYACYFEKNRLISEFMDDSSISSLLLQKSPVSLQIYHYLKQYPQISIRDLQIQFNLSRSTIQYHLNKLRKMQLIPRD